MLTRFYFSAFALLALAFGWSAALVGGGYSSSLLVAVVVYHVASPWATPSVPETLEYVLGLIHKYVLRTHFIFSNVSRMPSSLLESSRARAVLCSVLPRLKFAFNAQ